MSALPSLKKTHSEKHKQILKQLLREDANKTCVDCKTAAHPRWASWNLGCFICIRCSGIHRSMGVHISKVKSVDLDAWTDAQVELMIKWGNAKCNSYWEAKLPEGYVPDPLKIENFIRTKYDMKKWVASSAVPDPSTIAVANATKSAPAAPSVGASSAHSPSKLKHHAPSKASATSLHKTHTMTSHSHNLLDDDFGSFTSAPKKPAVPVKPKTSPTLNKLPLQSSPSGLTSSQSTGGSMNGRPDLKKSILSLYSSPSSSSSSFIQPQQQYSLQADTSSLTSSLNGLNFGTSATPASQKYNLGATNNMGYNSSTSFNNSSSSSANTAPGNASASSLTWNNNWSDVPSGTARLNSNTYANSLDDDLFKNVWK